MLPQPRLVDARYGDRLKTEGSKLTARDLSSEDRCALICERVIWRAGLLSSVSRPYGTRMWPGQCCIALTAHSLRALNATRSANAISVHRNWKSAPDAVARDDALWDWDDGLGAGCVLLGYYIANRRRSASKVRAGGLGDAVAAAAPRWCVAWLPCHASMLSGIVPPQRACSFGRISGMQQRRRQSRRSRRRPLRRWLSLDHHPPPQPPRRRRQQSAR